MEKKGLIERIIDKKDRRSIRVVATEQGMSMRDDVLKVIDELNQKVLAGFTPEQLENFLSCLRQIGMVDQPSSEPAQGV